MEETAFCFYNVVPCSPGQEKLLADQMIELEERTGIRIALYTLTLHPEGFPASRKAEYLTESYRRFSSALAGSRVRPGVLIQSILGHWPRVDKDEEQWTRTINIEGEAARFCPLDPQYRQYIFNTIAALAKEKPCFFLGDDDIRGFSPHAECFCPLHTAEYNRRTGSSFTPEEYRQAVRNSKVGDPVFTAYEQLREDTVNGVCKLIREAIDSVDPTIPAGTCMPGWEQRFNGDAARAIAAKGQPPVMRLANGSYMESTLQGFSDNFLMTQTLRLFHQNIPVVLCEADTCPHNLYSKSARTFHLGLLSSMFAGVSGAKIWYVNGYKFGLPISRKYTDILAKYRNHDQVLAAALKNAKPEGIVIPAYDRFPNWHPLNSDERSCPAENWVTQLLGVYGIPFQASFRLDQDRIYAVAGADSIRRFSDEQLKQLLSRRLLLDGPATVELVRRGFASELGVNAEMKDFRFNREFSADGKQLYPTSKNPNVPFLTVENPAAEVITWLGYAPFNSSPDIEKAAPGAVIFRNSLGGTVCSTAYHLSILWSWAAETRKLWLLNLLERLEEKQLPYVLDEDQWCMMLHRTLPEGGELLGIFNLGYDPMEELPLRCPEQAVRFEHLIPDGVWKPLAVRRDNDRTILPVRLECGEMAAIRVVPGAEDVQHGN